MSELHYTLQSYFRPVTLRKIIMHPAEGQRMEIIYFSIILAAVLAVVFALRLLRPTIDPREPPLVSPKIPVFGHALGLLRCGVPYYAMVT